MKLMIEPKELFKLTKQQTNNLKNWYKNRGLKIGDYVYYESNLTDSKKYIVIERDDMFGIVNDTITPFTPILNIGQMIQLLCDSGFGFPKIELIKSKKKSECVVVCVSSKYYDYGEFEAGELCDALWDAVKYMLRGNFKL